MKPYPRALLWVAMLSTIGIMIASLWLLRADSVSVLVAGLTAIGGTLSVDRWAAAYALTRSAKEE